MPPTISQMMNTHEHSLLFSWPPRARGGLPASRRAMRARCSGFGRDLSSFGLRLTARSGGQAGSIAAVTSRASVALLALVLVAILLDARDAQARHAAAVDRALPAGELLEAERVALARFVDAQQAAGDRGDDLGLAANDPARRVRQAARLSSVSGSPSGPMTWAGRIFWFSSILRQTCLIIVDGTQLKPAPLKRF